MGHCIFRAETRLNRRATLTSAWTARIISLYPELFPGPLGASVTGRALEEGIWSLETTQLRDFAHDRHGSVDAAPAGGGPGMVLRADVVGAAIEHVRTSADTDIPAIYLSPRGEPFTQELAREFSQGAGAILLCGRFEGVDERVIEQHRLREISIGDYVMTGGELAAMVLIDSVVRLLPGVVGDERSLGEESFQAGLLEYPQYTKPRSWEGLEIPEVLLSGDHGRIADWRLAQSKEITAKRRPDLMARKKDKE